MTVVGGSRSQSCMSGGEGSQNRDAAIGCGMSHCGWDN